MAAGGMRGLVGLLEGSLVDWMHRPKIECSAVVAHSINSSDNSPLSHCVLQVLFVPYWSFQLYISS